MAYSSGFTAVTGATFLASQYNTYVRDNFSAIWVFSALGDMIYATSSTTAARLAKGAGLTVMRINPGTTLPEWANGALFTPYVPQKTNSSWDGDNHGVGTTTLAATDFDASLAAGAVALLVTVSARWVAASGASVVVLRPAGGAGNCLVVRSHTANVYNDNMGIVPLSSGNFEVQVSNAAADVFIDIWGYFR